MAKQRQDKTTTDFPKIGAGGPPTRVAPVTSNLKTTSKANQSKGGARAYGMLDGVMAHRTGIQENMGSQLRISATLYKANAAEAGATQRNVRLVPSAMGNRDFSLRRRYNQGV